VRVRSNCLLSKFRNYLAALALRLTLLQAYTLSQQESPTCVCVASACFQNFAIYLAALALRSTLLEAYEMLGEEEEPDTS
jgi:hypothetical protein